VSTLRESFERASLPALTFLNGLPRFVPFLGILVLALAGILLPSPAWLLLVVVIAVLLWIAALAWPRLSGAERLMRLAVVAMLVAILVTQVVPRG
jgi:membrane protein DedA with SNARE-associated domain